jgi:hypothetical protein
MLIDKAHMKLMMIVAMATYVTAFTHEKSPAVS